MPKQKSLAEIRDLERKALHALCTDEGDADAWRRQARRLADHAWNDPEHKVVYDALRAIRSGDAETRRKELPAQVTRMGFPDVDWSNYLDEERSSDEALEELITALQAD